jgi:subtilisin-like proprotein convertase family protein
MKKLAVSAAILLCAFLVLWIFARPPQVDQSISVKNDNAASRAMTATSTPTPEAAPAAPWAEASPASTPRQNPPTAQAQSSLPTSLTFTDAGMPRDFELALDEVYTKDSNGKGTPVPVQASSADELEKIIAGLDPTHSGGVFPVLYERGAERNEFTRRIVTEKVTIKLAEGADPAAIASQAGTSSYELPSYAAGFAILAMNSPFESLRASRRLSGNPSIEFAEPMLARQQSKRALPNDTLINQQWHLKFNNQTGAVAGTDLNIESVWAYPTSGAGFRGRGIRIGIVDDGLQTSHPDFAGNIDTTNDYDWNDSSPNDPSPGPGDDHGTACGGDAAARGNNNLGVCGSAPEGTLVGMRLIAAVTTDQQEAAAMSYLPQLIQIKSNSWGPSDTGSTLEAPGPLTQAALKNATESGRGGLGTIITWAGGNGLGTNDNSNYDGYANSIYTLAVGAFDSQSRQAGYSESGANLVIVSPSSGNSPALGKTTTDRTGADGYVSGDYESDFGGTSSATPTASGVIALMLEANPNLGWRDVQEILMRSAKKVNPSDTDWKVPVAPDNINHNHKFGGGLIDASAAVSISRNWTNLGPQLKRTSPQTGLSVAIPNVNTTGITREFLIAPTDNLRVEHVTITVNINHTARGNLKITLTSPSGTVSRFAEVRSDSNDNYSNWTFMTVRNWGENASGTWRLKISDESGTGNTTGGTLTAATLEIFGTSTVPLNPAPSVVLTNPANDTTLSPGGNITLSATATDLTASGANGIVSSVAFLSNGTVLSTDTTAPYSFNWTPTVGTYSIAARATDSENATVTTPVVSVQVVNRRPSISAATISPPGQAFTDQALSVAGLVSSDPDSDPVGYAYQWQSSLNNATFTDTSGETAQTLSASPARSGLLWRCSITPSDSGGPGETFVTETVALNRRPPTTATAGQSFSYDSDLFLRGSETSFNRAAILSEFSQGPSGGSAEWIEFLVLKPGSLRGWKIQDAGGTTVTLADVPAWDNIPAGTLVVIYNGASKDLLLPADDSTPGSDNCMVVSSADASFCTGIWPSLRNNGDGVILRDASNNILSQVGYGSGTTSPNIGAVGSTKSANYRGNTEGGWLQPSNWSIESAATARRNISKAVGDLFISEYVEGSSNNKAVELFNPSENSVNLSSQSYALQIYANGATVASSTITLNGTVAPYSTFVLKHSSANASITAQQTSGSLTFNGDDALVLKKGTSVVDVFGQIGNDPGPAWTSGNTTTVDATLRRKSGITVGDMNGSDAFNPSLEWDAFPTDSFAGLGSHSFSGGGGNTTGLALSLSPSTFSEAAGANASTATLSITQAPSQNLTANLTSSDTSELTVPATATIPAGQTTVTFPVSAVDEAISDGPQTVTLTANSGNLSATAMATVTDNEASLNGVTPGSPNGGDNSFWVAQLRSGTLNQPAFFRLGAGSQTPAGLSIDAQTGILSGTPAIAGDFTITIERYNSLGETATQSFQLSVTVSSTTNFSDWVATFPSLTGNNATATADPDDDGLPNLLEYFMGLNATATDYTPQRAVMIGSDLTLDYRRSKSQSGLTGAVEWTTSLSTNATWSSANVTDSLLNDQGAYENRRATVPVLSGESKKFLRLRINPNP